MELPGGASRLCLRVKLFRSAWLTPGRPDPPGLGRAHNGQLRNIVGDINQLSL